MPIKLNNEEMDTFLETHKLWVSLESKNLSKLTISKLQLNYQTIIIQNHLKSSWMEVLQLKV